MSEQGETPQQPDVQPNNAELMKDRMMHGIDMLPTRTAIAFFRKRLGFDNQEALASSLGIGKSRVGQLEEDASRSLTNYFEHMAHPLSEDKLNTSNFTTRNNADLYKAAIIEKKNIDEISSSADPIVTPQVFERTRAAVSSMLKQLDDKTELYNLNVLVGPQVISEDDLHSIILRAYPGESKNEYMSRISGYNLERLTGLETYARIRDTLT